MDEPTSLYKCTVCSTTQRWQAWSGKARIALKCHTCDKLTLHELVLPKPKVNEEPGT